MANKWIDEKVLQKYFVENCLDYSVVIEGNTYPITSARFNEPFDRFPDIYCVVNGEEYPVEVEWLSSHYDHHVKNKDKSATKPYTHEMFEKDGGFLVVLEKDCEVFSFQQVIIDNDKLRKWFTKNAVTLLNESIVQFYNERVKKRKHPKIWFIYVSEAVSNNWKYSKKMGIWGFTEGRMKSNKELKEIQENDLVIFAGSIKTGSLKLDGWPRVKDEELKKVENADDYIIENIEIFKVIKSYYNELDDVRYKTIWPDETTVNKKYPHRFEFEPSQISNFSKVTFKQLNYYTLVKLKEAVMRSPIEIDYSHFVELLRNFK
ncbi:hypothetical protein ACFPRB_18145 [Metabacillus niabensis]|uniref:Uncharacterized protein n=2 Tax=Metabacillus niabensis TaxID=324854 RepID=A0ABT9ZBF0_9BACI|nr:hypothetical protein [Metabacillus niabensis]MDQ0228605.1 hypothetical protein [Metabacillus niabensis]